MSCTLQGLSLKRPVVVGKEAFGLYLLDKSLVKEVQISHALSIDYCNKLPILSVSSDVSCNHISKNINFDTWHRRIDHVPFQRIKLLPIDVTTPKNNEHVPCDVCPKSKQQRLPFHECYIFMCTFWFVHIDTWGPYHNKTYSGHRFFVTIVDDYIRITWTHLMVTKDEAIGLMKAFVKMAQTQFSCTVKTIGSDNALNLPKAL